MCKDYQVANRRLNKHNRHKGHLTRLAAMYCCSRSSNHLRACRVIRFYAIQGARDLLDELIAHATWRLNIQWKAAVGREGRGVSNAA